jgi:hypothetical protein
MSGPHARLRFEEVPAARAGLVLAIAQLAYEPPGIALGAAFDARLTLSAWSAGTGARSCALRAAVRQPYEPRVHVEQVMTGPASAAIASRAACTLVSRPAARLEPVMVVRPACSQEPLFRVLSERVRKVCRAARRHPSAEQPPGGSANTSRRRRAPTR